MIDGAGLGLEVSPRGLKSWRLRYRFGGKPGKINLGRWPEMSLAKARTERDRLINGILAGHAPARLLNRPRASKHGISLQVFAERYMKEIVAKERKKPKAVRRYLERDIYPALGQKNLTAITASDVRELVFARRDAGRAQAAVSIRNLLKRIFDYAVICEVATANPAHATPIKFIAKTKSRERALSEAEIRLFLKRLDTARVERRLKISLRIVLMTLVRKSELRLAEWHQVSLERAEWEIPPELSKTGKGQIVYLSRQVQELFKKLGPAGGFVFPHRASRTQPMAANTLNKALARISKGMAHFTVHDLRRTASTRLNEMKFGADVIEKALNHSIKGPRGIYNRAQYADERKEMLQAWADYLDRISGGAAAE